MDDFIEASFAMVVHFISSKLKVFHLAVLTTLFFSFCFCSAGIHPRTSYTVGKCSTTEMHGQHKLSFDTNHSSNFGVRILVLKLLLKE